MASIPLPALNVNTQAPSPIAEYAKLQQIQGMQQEAQTRQLQQTALGQENQQRQLQLQDSQTLRSLSTKHVQKDADGNVTGFDFDGLMKDASAAGVSPQTLNQMQNQRAETIKNLQGADDATRNAQIAKNKAFYEGLESLRGIKDPAQRSAALPGVLANLQKQGVDTSKIPQNAPLDDNSLNQFEATLGMHAQVLDDAKKAADTAATKLNSETTAAKEAREAAEFAAKLPGGGMENPEQKYIRLQASSGQGQKLNDADNAWIKGYEKNKALTPTITNNLQNANAAADANGNPSAIAQAIANNQMKWSEAVSMRTPIATKNAILKEVYKLNPNFDTSEFGLEADAAKKARSGAWADTRLAYNTALDHSDLLLQASDALKNGNVKLLNSLENKFKTEFGWSGKINYDAIANAYNHEVNSVISKGHITDKEVETGHATLPSDANSQTIHDVVNSYKALMTSKRGELDKIIKAGAGNKADAILKIGSDSGTLPKSLSASDITAYANAHNVPEAEVKRQAKAKGIQVPN